MSSPVFAEDDVLDWDDSRSFSGWIGTVRARAVAHLQLLDDRAELIRSTIRALEEYQALRARGTGTTAAADLRRTPWLRAGIAAVDGFYLSGRRTLFDLARAVGADAAARRRGRGRR